MHRTSTPLTFLILVLVTPWTESCADDDHITPITVAAASAYELTIEASEFASGRNLQIDLRLPAEVQPAPCRDFDGATLRLNGIVLEPEGRCDLIAFVSESEFPEFFVDGSADFLEVTIEDATGTISAIVDNPAILPGLRWAEPANGRVREGDVVRVRVFPSDESRGTVATVSVDDETTNIVEYSSELPTNDPDGVYFAFEMPSGVPDGPIRVTIEGDSSPFERAVHTCEGVSSCVVDPAEFHSLTWLSVRGTQVP